MLRKKYTSFDLIIYILTRHDCLLAGLEKLSELSSLEVLNLESNNFNRSVLSSLSRLTSLKSLNLDLNPLDGSSNYIMISNFN